MPGLEIGESRAEDQEERRTGTEARLAALESDIASLRGELDRLTSLLEGSRTANATTEAQPARPAPHSRVRTSVEAARQKTIGLLFPAPRGEWSPSGRMWDVFAIVLLLIVAIPLRFVHLGTVPYGFHGDEAAVGLEAQRILQHGWIGPYSGEAGGTPAGAYYAAAVAIHFLGSSIYSARFASAVFDTLTVVLVYVLVRRNFGWGSAVLAGLFTAVSTWQLEFARLAFINSAWPFCVIAATTAFCEAIRTRAPAWWLVAGALWAAGLYSYSGQLLLLGVIALFLLFYFAGLAGVATAGIFAAAYVERGALGLAAVVAGLALLAVNRRLRNRIVVGQVAAFGLAFLAVAWPIIQFARSNRETYFRTGRGVTVFEDDEWSAMHGQVARAWWLTRRYFEFWDRAVRHPVQDGIDGTGAAPMIPLLLALLCLVGIWLSWRRRRQPLVVLGVLVIGLMPLAVATSNNFPLRRASVIAPFVAMFAAVAFVELLRSAWRMGAISRFGATLLLVVCLTLIVYRDLDGYFNKTARSPGMYWTLAGDLVHSVHYMEQLPPGSYVYFYSERWPFDSGERLFLAPRVKGESRGAEFGENSLALDTGNGRPVVILIGKYEDLLPAFQLLHPNSAFEFGPPVPETNGEPSFIAFFPTPGEIQSAPAPTDESPRFGFAIGERSK